jgi:hypothetical protein
MATDYWPDEEGYIVEGLTIGFCYADAAIGEMDAVQVTGTTAGRVRVATSAATGDSQGVALKAAGAAGAYIPVAFTGVVKMTAACSISVGDLVAGAITGDSVIEFDDESDNLTGLGGSAWLLGMALQAAATTGDEILVLLGRSV